MARPFKPASADDVSRVARALDDLRRIAGDLRAAGCDQAAARARLAITSTEGALRHIQGRRFRTIEGEGA